MRTLLVAAPLLAGVLLGSIAHTSGAVGAPEPARAASAFVDSVGINVHFAYDDGPYGKRAAIASLIRTLGVRHLRDGLTAGRNDVCATDRRLAAEGIRFTYIAQAQPQRAALQAWASCAGDALEAFEGLNEYDISHPAGDTAWADTVRSSQTALYRAVKGDPALARLTVIGPSLTSEGAARTVGDLSAALDVGNTHDYFAGHEPGTPGWGLGGYGSIAWNLQAARLVSGDKPVDATETGYATPPSPGAVDDATQAAYVPRMFLAQARAGIRRTFEYELVDEGAAPFGTYGLVRNDLTPKPAFRALASLLRELRGNGTATQLPPLGVVFDGAPADLAHLIFARSDGTYVVALWRDGAIWDPRAQRPIAVATQTVSLRVATRLARARVVALDADGNLSAQPVRQRPEVVRVPVGPRVTFVELRAAS